MSYSWEQFVEVRTFQRVIAMALAVPFVLTGLCPASLTKDLLMISESGEISTIKIGEYRERIKYELTRRCLQNKAALHTVVHFVADGRGNLLELTLQETKLSPAQNAALETELKALKFANAPGKSGGYLKLTVNFDIEGPLEEPPPSDDERRDVSIDQGFINRIQTILDERRKPEPEQMPFYDGSEWCSRSGEFRREGRTAVPDELEDSVLEIFRAMNRGELESVKANLNTVVAKGLTLGQAERKALTESLIDSSRHLSERSSDLSAQVEFVCQSIQKLIDSLSPSSVQLKSELLFVRSRFAYRKGDYTTARSCAQEIIQLNQKNSSATKFSVDAYRELARAANAQHDQDKVIECHTAAMSLLSKTEQPECAQKITDLSEIIKIKLKLNQQAEAMKIAREIEDTINKIPRLYGQYIPYIEPMNDLEDITGDFARFPFPCHYLNPKERPVAEILCKSFYTLKLKMYGFGDRELLNLCLFLLANKKIAESDALYDQAISDLKKGNPQYYKSSILSLAKDYAEARELAGVTEKHAQVSQQLDEDKQHKERRAADQRQKTEETVKNLDSTATSKDSIEARLKMFSYLWKDGKVSQARGMMENIITATAKQSDLDGLRDSFRWPLVQILEQGTSQDDTNLAIKLVELFEAFGLKEFVDNNKQFKTEWREDRYGFYLEILSRLKDRNSTDSGNSAAERMLPVLMRVVEIRKSKHYPKEAVVSALHALTQTEQKLKKYDGSIAAQTELIETRERQFKDAQQIVENAKQKKAVETPVLISKIEKEQNDSTHDEFNRSWTLESLRRSKRVLAEALDTSIDNYNRAKTQLTSDTIQLAILNVQAGNFEAARKAENSAREIEKQQGGVGLGGGSITIKLRTLIEEYSKFPDRVDDEERVMLLALELAAQQGHKSELTWLWEPVQNIVNKLEQKKEYVRACDLVQSIVNAADKDSVYGGRSIEWLFTLGELLLYYSTLDTKGMKQAEYLSKSKRVFESVLETARKNGDSQRVERYLQQRIADLHHYNLPDEAKLLEDSILLVPKDSPDKRH